MGNSFNFLSEITYLYKMGDPLSNKNLNKFEIFILIRPWEHKSNNSTISFLPSLGISVARLIDHDPVVNQTYFGYLWR